MLQNLFKETQNSYKKMQNYFKKTKQGPKNPENISTMGKVSQEKSKSLCSPNPLWIGCYLSAHDYSLF